MLSEFLGAQLGAPDAGKRPPLHRQLYEALRRALIEGKLAAGKRLPSTRDLAQDLQVSRNTVVAAVEQLCVEGYLQSRVGSGTYASESLPRPNRLSGAKPLAQSARLSRRGEMLAHEFGARELEVQPFTPGPPDFSAFPAALWQRMQNKHWRVSPPGRPKANSPAVRSTQGSPASPPGRPKANSPAVRSTKSSPVSPPEMLDYSSPGGHAPLRRALANYLRVSRSVALDPEQVIITSGTQQSLGLCAHLLADVGDKVWIEDPAYWGAVKAFLAAGLQLYGVPVDASGIAPQAADTAHPPRLIYVTPSHQYPSGAVMSPARRQQILALAATHQAWVLEDDYDSEFRFSGAPLSSLQGLDQEQRVFYLGSFSKVLYPGIKLGYLVVPERLVESFRSAHYDLNRPGQMPVQAALAEFIEMGHFASALRRARQSYALRRQCLLDALAPCLGHGVHITGAEQGLHLCLSLPADCDDRALARDIARLGLTVRPLSAYCLARQDLRGLIIGYGYAPYEDIRREGPKLARCVLQALGAMPLKQIAKPVVKRGQHQTGRAQPSAAGKVAMRQSRQQVKATGLA